MNLTRRQLYALGEPFGESCTRMEGGKRIYGGGDGGSSSSSTATTTNTTDKRQVVDGGVGVSSDQSTVSINMLDAGTVARAFDSVDKNSLVLSSGLAQLLDVTDSVAGLAKGNAQVAGQGFSELLDLAGSNSTLTAGGFGRLIDLAESNSSVVSGGFSQLLTLADGLFAKGADVIGKAQDITVGQMETFNAGRADEKGAIDQKTMVIIAVAAAAALVLTKGR